uniref:Uncharacterized protein n=1 Tax=Glossina pallidipes TaxID=7398 RepID=A0A1A9Z382_GLOPL
MNSKQPQKNLKTLKMQNTKTIIKISNFRKVRNKHKLNGIMNGHNSNNRNINSRCTYNKFMEATTFETASRRSFNFVVMFHLCERIASATSRFENRESTDFGITVPIRTELVNSWIDLRKKIIIYVAFPNSSRAMKLLSYEDVNLVGNAMKHKFYSNLFSQSSSAIITAT